MLCFKICTKEVIWYGCIGLRSSFNIRVLRSLAQAYNLKVFVSGSCHSLAATSRSHLSNKFQSNSAGIRPTDLKHEMLLPVGQEIEFKIKKNRMFVKALDGDRKARSSSIVAMKPANPLDESQSSAVNPFRP